MNSTIFHISTIKPFDNKNLINILKSFKIVISLDDNNYNGITNDIKFLKYFYKNKKFLFYSYQTSFVTNIVQ